MKRLIFLFIVCLRLCSGNFLFSQEEFVQAGPGPANPLRPVLSPKRKAELEKATKEIRNTAARKGLNAEEKEKAVGVFARLADNGIPVKPAKEVVNASIRQGLKSEEIDEVADIIIERRDRVHPENLGKDVQELLARGLRGKELAAEIHKLIEERHQQKMEEQRKKREEKKAIHQERKKESREENEPEERRRHRNSGVHPFNPGGGKRN